MLGWAVALEALWFVLVGTMKNYPGKRRAFFLLGHVGLLTGHHFTPLPWFTDTLAAAW